VFFDAPVTAATARSLGASLLREAAAARAELDLASYDRFFPSQDFVPRGSLGNLIALPLQGELRATRADTGEVLHIRMRRGQANTMRGAERFVRELAGRVRRAGAAGQLTIRADSGFWAKAVIGACQQLDIRFSISVRAGDARIAAAIARIPEGDWQAIDYIASGEAQVAETTYRGLRLVVRRSRLGALGRRHRARHPPAGGGKDDPGALPRHARAAGPLGPPGPAAPAGPLALGAGLRDRARAPAGGGAPSLTPGGPSTLHRPAPSALDNLTTK
jgi:hypothetical protein